MSKKEKESEPATIASLMASRAVTNSGDSDFFLPKNVSHGNLKSASKAPLSVAVESRLRDANMLVSGSQLGERFSDEYRRIKRPLLANAFGKTASLVEQGNLILVTSSIPGEGKTHTAANLALSMAQEKDHTVLLVDCDVNKHGITRLFGLTDKPGLVDVLESDSLSIGDVMLRTDIPELSIISAGKGNEYVTEMLASQKMFDFVSELASRYDDRVIIFDGPPLLPTPQTQVLAGLVGQIVFVIEAGKTPQMLVREALEMIPREKATNLVVNKSEGMSDRGGYYYGYYGSES
ncbi:MAG: XrtA-associated tyrosine autokinase [Gammaproteobacteria bacterium]|nr:XrtA-associated tyrosine autokinase [Gammaproteobacteria bacterium]